jgi:hypothetical protein
MPLVKVKAGRISGADETPPSTPTDEADILIQTADLYYAEEQPPDSAVPYVVASFAHSPIAQVILDRGLDDLRKLDRRLAVVWTADITPPEATPPNARANSKRCIVNLDHVQSVEAATLYSGEVYLKTYVRGGAFVLDIFEKTFDQLIDMYVKGDEG